MRPCDADAGERGCRATRARVSESARSGKGERARNAPMTLPSYGTLGRLAHRTPVPLKSPSGAGLVDAASCPARSSTARLRPTAAAEAAAAGTRSLRRCRCRATASPSAGVGCTASTSRPTAASRARSCAAGWAVAARGGAAPLGPGGTSPAVARGGRAAASDTGRLDPAWRRAESLRARRRGMSASSGGGVRSENGERRTDGWSCKAWASWRVRLCACALLHTARAPSREVPRER